MLHKLTADPKPSDKKPTDIAFVFGRLKLRPLLQPRQPAFILTNVKV